MQYLSFILVYFKLETDIMMKYTVKRLFELLPLLFLISVAAFAMVRILPVDPATAYLDSVNIPATDEAVAQIK